MLLPFGLSAQYLQTKPTTYLTGFIDRQSLRPADNNTQLRPVVGSAVVGYWVRPGVGLELEVGIGVADDSIDRLDFDFNSQLGVSLRLESQPVNDFAAYALFGYVRSDYDLSSGGSNTSITLPGGRLAAGMTYVIKPGLRFDAGFSHHDYDDEARVNSFRFGLRYELNRRNF